MAVDCLCCSCFHSVGVALDTVVCVCVCVCLIMWIGDIGLGVFIVFFIRIICFALVVFRFCCYVLAVIIVLVAVDFGFVKVAGHDIVAAVKSVSRFKSTPKGLRSERPLPPMIIQRRPRLGRCRTATHQLDGSELTIGNKHLM